MHRSVFITVSGALAIILGVLIFSEAVSAQREGPQGARQPGNGTQPIYNPYPLGLLPSDLASELARVEREVDHIFQEALKQWKAIPPPTVAGNPPTLQGSGMRLVQILGKLELFDKTISVNKNTACSSCHMPYAGFS